jgi:undecaprenyl-diphosphatase
MEPWHAAILGLVEGLTEYLPISSTGHLIIVSALLGLDAPPETKRAVDTYNIIIQGGAILAVLGLYRVRVLSMLRGLVGADRRGLRLFVNLVVAFIPAMILGLLLESTIQRYLFSPIPVLVALGVGGVALLVLTPWQRKHFHEEDEEIDAPHYVRLDELTWKQALIIGLMQCVAMWPGTSRSMMTIIGGMLIGLRPKHAAEFSFLLGLPTLGGACVYKAGRELFGEGEHMFDVLQPMPLVIGFVMATISAAIAIRWFVTYLSRHGVALFGWYRIGLCLVFAVLWWLGVVTF